MNQTSQPVVIQASSPLSRNFFVIRLSSTTLETLNMEQNPSTMDAPSMSNFRLGHHQSRYGSYILPRPSPVRNNTNTARRALASEARTSLYHIKSHYIKSHPSSRDCVRLTCNEKSSHPPAQAGDEAHEAFERLYGSQATANNMPNMNHTLERLNQLRERRAFNGFDSGRFFLS